MPTKKLYPLSQAGSQIVVTASSVSLKDLIQTADAGIPDSAFEGELVIDFVELNAEDGTIRYAQGAAPTTSKGSILFEGNGITLEGIDARTFNLIRDSVADVKVNIQIGRTLPD